MENKNKEYSPPAAKGKSSFSPWKPLFSFFPPCRPVLRLCVCAFHLCAVCRQSREQLYCFAALSGEPSGAQMVGAERFRAWGQRAARRCIRSRWIPSEVRLSGSAACVGTVRRFFHAPKADKSPSPKNKIGSRPITTD